MSPDAPSVLLALHLHTFKHKLSCQHLFNIKMCPVVHKVYDVRSAVCIGGHGVFVQSDSVHLIQVQFGCKIYVNFYYSSQAEQAEEIEREREGRLEGDIERGKVIKCGWWVNNSCTSGMKAQIPQLYCRRLGDEYLTVKHTHTQIGQRTSKEK